MTAQSSEPDKGTKIAPWEGGLFVLFEERPWIKPFFKWHAGIIIFAYPALIALANSFEASFLPPWFAFWSPLVEALSTKLPIFSNLEEAFAVKYAGRRVGMMQHLLAYEWIVTPPLLVLMIAVTLQTPKVAWTRFAASRGYKGLLFMFFFTLVLAPFSIYWMIFGIDLTSENLMWNWHRSDLTVPVIGVFFGCAISCSVMLIASFGGLIAKIGMQLRKSSA